VVFARGRAIGRLWELSGEQASADVQVSTFLQEATPVVFQQYLVCNTSDRDHRLDIILDLDFASPATPT
jgi:hypothetical protein